MRRGVALLALAMLMGCGGGDDRPPLVEESDQAPSTVAGQTGGGGAAPSSTAPGSSPKAPVNGTCAALGACCLGLAPGDEAACHRIANAGVEATCGAGARRACNRSSAANSALAPNPCSIRARGRCDGSVASSLIIECAMADCFH